MNFHFIRIAHAVARHRKFLRTPSAAKWLWVLGIIYAQEVESDGFIPREVLPMLGYVEPDIQKSAERLVQAGLWIEVEGGYTIHDYLDYNYSAAQIEQLREVNRINGRKGGLAKTRSESPSDSPTGSHSELVSESPSPPVKQIRSVPYRTEVRTNSVQQASLVQPRRLSTAFEGERLTVPQDLHAEFIRLRNRPEAERELLAWYESVNEDWTRGEHKNASPGGNMFQFWRDRYSEKWPRPTVQRNNLPEWARES